MFDDGRYPSPKQTLDARGLRPRKRFGQNFLVDPRFARRVAESIPRDSFVVEIGAGTGSLTAALAAQARHVGAAGFYPAPTVASSVVRLSPRPDRAASIVDEALLLRTIRAAFAQRRKTLANCIAARAADDVGRAKIEAAIREAGLDPSIRGE